MATIKRNLGEVIRNQRLANGWSQEKLAVRCGLKRAYLGAIERGEKAINIETVQRIADGLGVRLGVLFTCVDELNNGGEK